MHLRRPPHASAVADTPLHYPHHSQLRIAPEAFPAFVPDGHGEQQRQRRKERVVRASLTRFARDRKQVEAEIARRISRS